jgi:hypothetical protein
MARLRKRKKRPGRRRQGTERQRGRDGVRQDRGRRRRRRRRRGRRKKKKKVITFSCFCRPSVFGLSLLRKTKGEYLLNDFFIL